MRFTEVYLRAVKVCKPRNAYARAATVVHLAWLERRDRNPLIWCLPLACAVAILGPR